MRALTDDGGARSAFAVAHFCYAVARQGAGMAAAMGGCDAIVFTGGIGENAAAVRAAILDRLRWLGIEIDPTRNDRNGPRLHADGSTVEAWVVAADEEREIARDALTLLRKG